MLSFSRPSRGSNCMTLTAAVSLEFGIIERHAIISTPFARVGMRLTESLKFGILTLSRSSKALNCSDTGVGLCRHVAKSGDKDRTARDSGDKAL